MSSGQTRSSVGKCEVLWLSSEIVILILIVSITTISRASFLSIFFVMPYDKKIDNFGYSLCISASLIVISGNGNDKERERRETKGRG